MTRVPSHTTPDGLDPEALNVFEHIRKSRGNVIGSFAVLLMVSSMTAFAID